MDAVLDAALLKAEHATQIHSRGERGWEWGCGSVASAVPTQSAASPGCEGNSVERIRSSPMDVAYSHRTLLAQSSLGCIRRCTVVVACGW